MKNIIKILFFLLIPSVSLANEGISENWQLSFQQPATDLMSDIMGQNWKYSVRLEILPDDAEGDLTPDPMGEDGMFEEATTKNSQSYTTAIWMTITSVIQLLPFPQSR